MMEEALENMETKYELQKKRVNGKRKNIKQAGMKEQEVKMKMNEKQRQKVRQMVDVDVDSRS